jgi:phage terminase small subunit
VVEGTGEGCSLARKISKAPDEKERLKAAELLGKRYRLFTENVQITDERPLIVDNIPDEAEGSGTEWQSGLTS